MGLRLVLQPHPLCTALYAISVRRLGTLPAASFRFHLTMDTLAVRLTLPTTKRVVDFHHQAITHGGRTKKGTRPLSVGCQTLLLSANNIKLCVTCRNKKASTFQLSARNSLSVQFSVMLFIKDSTDISEDSFSSSSSSFKITILCIPSF